MMQTSFKHFFVATALIFLAGKTHAQKLSLVPYATGFTDAIGLENCGDDRAFVSENNGIIRVVNADGTLRSTPFLDISSKTTYVPEGDFLGFTFSPDYKSSGKFYVYYTTGAPGNISSVLEEYKVSAADSNVADVNSVLRIITQPQVVEDHYGGNLMFGKDGFLYVNYGDGGPDGDTYGHSQDKTTFLGKILRIDVSNSSSAQPYTIPTSNPFYNDPTPGIKKEIWASGMRNPYKSSMDKITGDLWLPDVGEHNLEEVNFQDVNSAGGQNYGWNIMEGTNCFNPSTGCNTTGLTLPIYEYPHSVSNAIIGGYVVRSPESKSLFGMYIFADYIVKFVDGIRQSGGALSGGVTHLLAGTQLPNNPVSFGQDRLGHLYIIFYDDPTVYRLKDTSYLRHPQAYYTATDQGGTSYLLQGLQGDNLTYKWLKNNAVIPGATLPDYTVDASGTYSLVVTNELGFSDTSEIFPFGALPSQLISFAAAKKGIGINALQWKIGTELNISGYNILRKSDNEPDFSKIGFVKAKSASGIPGDTFDYVFTDSSAPHNSTTFYKLELISKTGYSTYSDIQKIVFDGRKMNFNFYPNPVKGTLYIDANGYSGPVMVVIYNNKGQKVKEQLLNTQTSTLDIQRLRGIYIIQLSGLNGENLIRKKLVVQ